MKRSATAQNNNVSRQQLDIRRRCGEGRTRTPVSGFCGITTNKMNAEIAHVGIIMYSHGCGCRRGMSKPFAAAGGCYIICIFPCL